MRLTFLSTYMYLLRITCKFSVIKKAKTSNQFKSRYDKHRADRQDRPKLNQTDVEERMIKKKRSGLQHRPRRLLPEPKQP